jgi:hypothetical protein
VLEFVEGVTLEERLRGGALTGARGDRPRESHRRSALTPHTIAAWSTAI